MTKPHACVPDDIAQQAKRVEDVIVEEASDPAAVLSLRSIHEAHTENLEPLVRARVRTVLQLKNKVSKRRKKRVPPLPNLLRNLEIPAHFANLRRHEAEPEPFFQTKLIVNGNGNREEIILLFATERFLKVLFTKRIVVADGGFKHAPRRFKQVK